MPIQQFAMQLQIPQLVHFTRTVNLPGILMHGLYPISRVGEVGVEPLVNDHERWDGHTDSTSVSIAHPNSQMFYKYRMEHDDTDWAVLTINPAILWAKPCAFCRYNAADARISGLPVGQLQTRQAFEEMFAPINNHKSREEQKLQGYDPTDVQAEVLVFDIIEPAYLGDVYFDNSTVRDRYAAVLGNRRGVVVGANKSFFASRSYVR
jgi:hypothetical protein